MGDPQNPYPLKAAPKVGDIMHLPTGVLVTPEQMLSIATDARVVYVGETHDNPASHRLELDVLKAMEERHPGKTALGMEMFVRSQQPVLDRWVAGKLDEKAFLKESHWFDNWKMDFGYYRDLLIYAKEHHIPVVALNAEKDLAQAVGSTPLEELSPEMKARLPEMDLGDPYQRGMAESIFAGHSHGKLVMDGFVRAQTLWDETMAESAARFLASPQGKDRHLVVIAGGNHVAHGFGIPRRVFRRIPTSYVTIGGNEIAITRKEEPEIMDVDLPDYPNLSYDFLNFLAYEELPETGVRLGIAYEPGPDKRGMQVQSVLPDSNAERAGVKEGDLLLTLDGEPLKETIDLVYGLKQKKVGEKSTLGVERDGKKLTLEVTFQKTEKVHQHGKP
ncbi:hypothetical protein GMST_41940 [Geomonas silvestris]|uniref:PDZ domain-containing protein n=1 Tax=Geomonas silvestris TaxID=2740184 RepID=A0A6V8MQI6_9BACT|nr:ChaN family lipoprotein [Geomonas silvestris]GFO61869.1 hypothetical protein GMST_41940 [Geomonas silvestris]